MSNDLTLTDIKTVVDEAMKSEVANLKRQILETTSNDEWTKNINYKAVCQHMDYAIFEFVNLIKWLKTLETKQKALILKSKHSVRN